MPKLEEVTPTSFSELLRFIEEYQDAHATVWYRGVSKYSYELKPSIARSKTVMKDEDIGELEREIGIAFAQRSPPFLDRELTGPWKTMFFMQHYGIPTRLLDWTESPFVSLYFALANVERKADGTPKDDAAIWLCDPVEWNRTSLSHISFKGGVLDETSEQLKAYRPDIEMDQKATQPIMIYGVHNSPRIVAQRGVFALFGKSMTSMEAFFKSGGFAEKTLVKIKITKENIDKI